MNLKEIQDLIKFVSKSGVNEVEIERKDFKIIIRTEVQKEEQTVILQQPQAVAPIAQPVVQAAAPQAVTAASNGNGAGASEENSNHITIKSPMIGTFYRRPSPDKPNFIEVGDSIKPGDVTCIIEAMKLFNEIESEMSGTIVKVLVDDSTPVEYDQPLFIIDPS